MTSSGQSGRGRRGCVLAAVLGVLAAVPCAGGVDTSGVMVLATNSLDGARRVFVVAVLPGAGITAAGMAADGAGNVYLSDYGAEPIRGHIVMVPRDGRPPVAIMDGLDQPSDIEMSPDGRALVIAEPDGSMVTRAFGVSVRVLYASGVAARDPVVFLKTDTGTHAATPGTDGYAHFPDLLRPPQTATTVDLCVRNGAATFCAYGQKLQLVEGQLCGQTILDVTIGK